MITLFDSVHIMAYAVAAMLIGTFLVLFHIGLIYFREKDADWKERIRNVQMAGVMHNSHLRVWLLDVAKKRYILLSERGTVEAALMPIDFSNLYKHTDFDDMRRQVLAIRDGKQKEARCRIRSMRMSDGNRRMYDVNIRVLEKDVMGRPKIIIGLQRDITDELGKREKVNNLLMLYHTIFDSSIIDTMYYDKHGVLREINTKACETFGIKDRKALLAREINIKDVPAYRNLDVYNYDGYRMSSITDIKKERDKWGAKIPEITYNGKIYYDTIMCPIYDSRGEIDGMYTAGRNINEQVESFHRQQESTRQLQATIRHIQDYIDNINVALRVSEVRFMYYRPDIHEMELGNDLNNAKLTLTQLRCISLVAPEHRRHAIGLIRKMDRREDTRIDVTLRTMVKDCQDRDMWLNFSVIPMKNADGKVTHYFGMCRNETEMVATEEKLKEERKKAQETELLKDAFLQNMSYEIRTPLSAVLGFAELLDNEHSTDDEQVFVEQIKQNSNLLLQLVNDILYISRLDAHMVEFKRQTTDFAMLFDAWCHQGFNGHNANVGVIVENPYEHLVINIDDGNLGIVVQRLCANAVAMTTEGKVRAKYEYRRGTLVISIEDSGAGFDKETVRRLFDRFVRAHDATDGGSGLTLPIVKEMIEQMGGEIEFQSTPGKGSLAWVEIPCEAMQIERKDLITA